MDDLTPTSQMMGLDPDLDRHVLPLTGINYVSITEK